jgi:hypothetical protein
MVRRTGIRILQRTPHETEYATLFVIKTLKTVFFYLKGDGPLNKKKNTQRPTSEVIPND